MGLADRGTHLVQPMRPHAQHVADVAHQRPGDGVRGHPLPGRIFHLRGVHALGEQRAEDALHAGCYDRWSVHQRQVLLSE
jgi:hypothetical protein